MSTKPEQPLSQPGDIYCESCGVLIFRNGLWVDALNPGVCSDCGQELCGKCAEWGEEGECITCREFPYSHCHYCGASFADELRGEYRIKYCPWCGHEITKEDIEKDPLRIITK